MRRLHVKIFLWFWVGVLLVSGTLVSLTELSHSRATTIGAGRKCAAPRHVARQESGILRREGPRAGALRRLVRDGSRRRQLHLRRRRQGSPGPDAGRAGAAAGELDGGLAVGFTSRGRLGAHHRRTRDRRPRRVAYRRRRLSEPFGAQPIAVRVPVAGHLRRGPEPRVDWPRRRGAAGDRHPVLIAGSPHPPADRWLRLAARNIANEQLQTRVTAA